MDNRDSAGKIITFYSFKGGVGRTMALANVAFLAAMNGKRVLVMDWDLEAPGLAYYFRGLLGAAAIEACEKTAGILDFLCGWSASVAKVGSEAELAALQKRFQEADIFAACAKSALTETSDFFPPGARLDMIGPGAKTIACLCNMSYEAALAQFSWADFFEKAGGGFMLAQLRLWAKANYDFVLIDSRTGLADAAGICTMQLPDTVALCFTLNQQNIDGTTKVAAAIRDKRGSDVTLRSVPMRVARRESKQDTDAKARAVSCLSNTGGFAADSISQDMDMLAIPLEDHLPYNEALAPFLSADPAFDPLTLHYMRLTQNLLDLSITMPHLDKAFLRQAQRRLAPKMRIIEHLASLFDVENGRVQVELDRLIGEVQAEVNLEPEDIAMFRSIVADVSGTDSNPHSKTKVLVLALKKIMAKYAPLLGIPFDEAP